MIHNIFSTPIYKTNISNYSKNEIINHIDNSVSGTFGDSDNIEQIHNIDLFNHLNNAISKHTKEYLKSLTDYEYNLYIQKSWGVRLKHNKIINDHQHLNAHISCVFYVSLPENCNNSLTFYNYTDLASRAIPIAFNERRKESETFSNLKNGDLLIFPSALYHGCTYPNESKENRYSISYDMCITKDKPKEFAVLDLSQWKKI